MTARSMTMPLLSIISLAAASSVLDLLRDFLWEVLVDIVPEKKKRKKKEAKAISKNNKISKAHVRYLSIMAKKKKIIITA
jgi:Co/Zn/Cd efflux system component